MRYILALVIAGSGCTPFVDPTPPPGPSALDGGAKACDASCTRYRELKCPEGASTADGHTCEEVCTNASTNGIDLAGPATCTTKAITCEEIRSCSE